MFASTRARVEALVEALSRQGVKAGAIHGDMDQVGTCGAVQVSRKCSVRGVTCVFPFPHTSTTAVHADARLGCLQIWSPPRLGGHGCGSEV